MPAADTTSLATRRQDAGRFTRTRVTLVLLIALLLGICDQNYWQYSNIDHYFTGYWLQFVHGTGNAPEQYRVAVKFAAWWAVNHLAWSFRYGYTLMDLLGSFAGGLLAYRMLERRLELRPRSAALDWFASAAFIALLCFYMIWQGAFIRPETLPTLGLTACMAWLWTREQQVGSRRVWVVLGLLAAAAAQGWVRADVAVALNAGVFIASVKRGGGLSIPRRSALATSLLCVLVAAMIQLYIMRVLFPQATYGNIPRIMLTRDLRQPLTVPPFLIFMLPIGWTAVQAWRRRASLDSAAMALGIGAAIYLALWIVLGKLDEVRIFVPFAVILTPLTIDLALDRISADIPLSSEAGIEAKV